VSTLQTRGRVTVKRCPGDARILLVSVEIQVPGLGRAPSFLIHDEPIETKDVKSGALLGWLQKELDQP
jgi:hypothetical protein